MRRFRTWCFLSLLISLPTLVHAVCPSLRQSGGIDPTPNVFWSFRDSVSACPAGDSLTFSTNGFHPARLRILVSYYDSNCNPRAGVPPESIYVTVIPFSGNAKSNDQPRVYADDATDALGTARITVGSLSGSGKVKVRVVVSGVVQGGFSTPNVRTPDSNADGIVTSSDQPSLADLNYSGVVDLLDLNVFAQSLKHSHRNALFGTPVQRTFFSQPYEYGEGFLSWSPGGDQVVYSAHQGCNADCVLDITAAGGSGNPHQFTFPGCLEDYDPSWSPRGKDIYYTRAGQFVMRKGVPGLAADTSEITIATVPDHSLYYYTDTQVSPNSRKVAFVRFTNATGVGNILVVNSDGDSLRQVTTETNATLRWPRWSPDGQFIYYGKESLSPPLTIDIYRIPAVGGTEELVFQGTPASTPFISPDGKALLAKISTIASTSIFAPTTLSLEQASPPPVNNYTSNATSYACYPAWSSDGTRTAFVGKPAPDVADGGEQLLVVRRNMNLPPVLNPIGDKVVEAGSQLSFSISASDPETDPLTYDAFFLETGMSFNPSLRTFSWTPGLSLAGRSYWLVFRVSTLSGGTASEVVKVSVIQPGATIALASLPPIVASSRTPGGIELVLSKSDARLAERKLVVYGVTGRVECTRTVRSGGTFRWDGHDDSGKRLAPGIYWYALSSPTSRFTGKLVLLP